MVLPTCLCATAHSSEGLSLEILDVMMICVVGTSTALVTCRSLRTLVSSVRSWRRCLPLTPRRRQGLPLRLDFRLAGAFNLNGLNDRGGEFVGYVVGDVNNSGVLMDVSTVITWWLPTMKSRAEIMNKSPGGRYVGIEDLTGGAICNS